ncbi:cyclophane-forming radical SAM peptide maturase AmcB [Hamadaea sp. NPDC051192]|uniref:cyclophane-forming radical SAM peptide maturase AmcB n=1 Tax=Hamadaea sp. NPDC051192 TaxID=3154940 RepID=UPI00342D58BC
MTPVISTAFHSLVVQPTTLCNLDCGYCYLPSRKRQRLMTTAVAKHLAASIAEQASTRPVEVIWHAGEPLTTPKGHFRALLSEFETLRRTGACTHSVQTNATLLDEAWCDLLKEYGFRIGVSVDGPGGLCGERVDWRGKAAIDKIERGIATLRRAGLHFSVICVVTEATIAHADELVGYFTDLGCSSVGFNIEEQESLTSTRHSVSSEQAEQFWDSLIRRRTAGSSLAIRDLDRLHAYLTGNPRPPKSHDPLPTVAYDGDTVVLSPELLGVTSADYGDFLAGNVLRESISSMLARMHRLRYVAEFAGALDRCAVSCEFWDFCGGAQAGNRYFETGRFDVMETAYCRNTRQALVRAAVKQLRKEVNA